MGFCATRFEFSRPAACSKLSTSNPTGSFWITIEGREPTVAALFPCVSLLSAQCAAGHQFEIPKSAWWLPQTQEACIESSPAGMNGLLIGDVFFREYLVQFDVSSPDKTVIGIGKLRPDYQPVRKLEQRRVVNVDAAPRELAQTLHVLPAFKRSEPKLTQRAIAPRSSQLPQASRLSALSSGSNTLLDDMPVFNRHGTQYFVNVSIGTPMQHFTVIFDTGSAVFGVFIRNSDLPRSISFSHMR